MEMPLPAASENLSLNVSEILNLYFARLQSDAETTSIWLQGIYEPGNDRQYGNYFYDRIRDIHSAEYVNLLVPPTLRSKLQPRHEIKIRGILSKRLREGGAIHLAFIAAHLYHSEAPKADPVQEARWKRLQTRAGLSRKNVDQLLFEQFTNEEKPFIEVFTGESSIVTQEFFNQLGPARDAYEINISRLNLKKPEVLAERIRKTASTYSAQLIVLMRGGGDGLDSFDNIVLADAILDSEVPVLAALGHATDITLARQVADRMFDTPTALGTWLKDIHERFTEHQANSKAMLLEQVRKISEQEIKLLEEQKSQLNKALESKEKNLEALQLNQKSQAEQNQQLHSHIQELTRQFQQTAEQHSLSQRELSLLRSELEESKKIYLSKMQSLRRNYQLLILLVAIACILAGVIAGIFYPPDNS